LSLTATTAGGDRRNSATSPVSALRAPLARDTAMRAMRILLALSLLEVVTPRSIASATTLRLIPTEAIARVADRAVAGQVVATEASWQGRRIVTRVALRPDDGSGDLWFELPGGTVGDITMQVLGMPAFRPGERALVLLVQREGRLRLVGLADGKLPIVRHRGRDVVYLRRIENGGRKPVPVADAVQLLERARLGRVHP
jgi:hypothetical protein